MTWLALPRADWRLVLGGAVLTTLAYPPFHFLIPSFVCVVPAVWLLHASQPVARPWRRQLAQGFWFGFLSHGFVLYWMVIALWHFTELSLLGYLATVAILALYMGLVFAVSGAVVRRTAIPLWFVFPVAWTAADWLIGHQGDIRFPWLGLGTSLTGFPPLVQIADVIGARGITFLLVVANVVLAEAFLVRAQARAWQVRVGAVFVGVLLAFAYGAIRMRTLTMEPVGRIAVIQPNVGASEKWDPLERSPDEIMSHMMEMSRAVLASEADLLVWPEAAVPGNFVSRPEWRTALAAMARETATPLLVGGIDIQFHPDNSYDYYNAAFYFDALGETAPSYRKRYLVPITERVPFVNPDWFRSLEFFGGFSEGQVGTVFPTAASSFGVLICYESVFENLARRYRKDGAAFLLNITNDAWFGRTSAPYQHAAHLVMRAVENRIGIARAANTGISGWVDPLGRVHEWTGLYQEATGVYPVMTGSHSPVYARWGDWVGALSVVATAAVGVLAWRRPQRAAAA